MSQTTTITYEHDECQDEIEVNLEYEKGDSNYGADADGNRGISVPGYFYTDDSAPEKCSTCGHIYTEDERKEIQDKIELAANEYEYEEPEPDYDDYYERTDYLYDNGQL